MIDLGRLSVFHIVEDAQNAEDFEDQCQISHHRLIRCLLTKIDKIKVQRDSSHDCLIRAQLLGNHEGVEHDIAREEESAYGKRLRSGACCRIIHD